MMPGVSRGDVRRCRADGQGLTARVPRPGVVVQREVVLVFLGGVLVH